MRNGRSRTGSDAVVVLGVTADALIAVSEGVIASTQPSRSETSLARLVERGSGSAAALLDPAVAPASDTTISTPAAPAPIPADVQSKPAPFGASGSATGGEVSGREVVGGGVADRTQGLSPVERDAEVVGRPVADRPASPCASAGLAGSRLAVTNTASAPRPARRQMLGEGLMAGTFLRGGRARAPISVEVVVATAGAGVGFSSKGASDEHPRARRARGDHRSPNGPTGLPGHPPLVVLSPVFAPGGRQLLSAGSDGTLQLWNVASRKPIGSPQPVEPNSYLAAVFAPDGKRVFAVSAGGSGARWELSPERWKQHACDVAGRELSPGEWNDALPGHPYRALCHGG